MIIDIINKLHRQVSMIDISTSLLARRISLRQLQVFEAVGRLLSFTKAAEELYLSQPTVSMQIKKLESALVCPLRNK